MGERIHPAHKDLGESPGEEELPEAKKDAGVTDEYSMIIRNLELAKKTGDQALLEKYRDRLESSIQELIKDLSAGDQADRSEKENQLTKLLNAKQFVETGERITAKPEYIPREIVEGWIREFVEEYGKDYRITPKETEILLESIPRKGIVSKRSLPLWFSSASRKLRDLYVSMEERNHFGRKEYSDLERDLRSFIEKKLG